MVCLGNICRSPMAAAVLFNKAKAINSPKILVSSSGTSGWHAGEGPNSKSLATWQEAGYEYEHTARPFFVDIFDQVDLILPMDLTNRANILNGARTKADREKVIMLRSFDTSLAAIDPISPAGQALQVPDPWGEDIESYRAVFSMIDAATDGLIKFLTS